MASVDSVLAQNLECAICQDLYHEPKQLSCTHTFCEKCLASLFEVNSKENQLACPICRQKTEVKNADVSTLQTNFPIKSLMEDITAAKQICSVCDQETRSLAVAFCQTCGVYMCSTCLDAHSKWKMHSRHEVVDSNDIKSGKVRMKLLCKKHHQEVMEWVCSTCKVSICFRCRMLDHNGTKHKVEPVAEFQKALKEEAKVLQEEAEKKLRMMEAHVKMLEEEREMTISALDQRIGDVVKALAESEERLIKNKDELVEKLQMCKKGMAGKLQALQESNLKTLDCIRSTCDLMTNGAKVFLEGESLVVHHRICNELQGFLARADCDDEKPRDITKRAKSIKFTRYSDQYEHKLGEIDFPWLNTEVASPPLANKQWTLKEISSFSISGAGVADMASTADGKMAVGYRKGGIDLFTVYGLQGTVLENTCIQSVTAFADGRYGIHNKKSLSVYSSELRELESIQLSSCSKSCLCVGENGDIFAFLDGRYQYGRYVRPDLNLFRPNGGKLVSNWLKEISTPDHASPMNHRPLLVLGSTSTISVITRACSCIYEVEVGGTKACPVVLEDDNILIGWVCGGYATVEMYSHDLRYMRTVLKGFRLHGNEFIMRAFSTGEVAICDTRALHVFRKS